MTASFAGDGRPSLLGMCLPAPQICHGTSSEVDR
jgi:hypothetical protein